MEGRGRAEEQIRGSGVASHSRSRLPEKPRGWSLSVSQSHSCSPAVGCPGSTEGLGVSLTMAVAFCTPSSSEGGTASSLALGVSGVGFWLHKRCLGVAQCCFHFPPDNV